MRLELFKTLHVHLRQSEVATLISIKGSFNDLNKDSFHVKCVTQCISLCKEALRVRIDVHGCLWFKIIQRVSFDSNYPEFTLNLNQTLVNQYH